MEEVLYEANGPRGGLLTPVFESSQSPQGAAAHSKAKGVEAKTLLDSIKSFRETLIGIVIVINCITMGLELDYPWDGWNFIEEAMLVLYIGDLYIRIREEGLQSFAMCPWSWVDTLAVLASAFRCWVFPFLVKMQQGAEEQEAVSVAMLLARMCRLIRAVRVFKVVRLIKPLFNLFSGLSEAVSSILWLLVFVFIILYIFALVFTELLGHGLLPDELDEESFEKAKETFATVPLSLYALFRAMSADLTDLGPLLSASSGVVLPVCYVFFQICTSWLLLSSLTATVVKTMLQFAETKTHEEEFQKRKVVHERLSDFFDGMEVNGYDEFGGEELQAFLAAPGSAEMLHSIADISVQKAFMIWDAMQIDGAVSLGKYIDQLASLSSDSVETSIFRLEMHIGQLYELINQYLPVLYHMSLCAHSERPQAADLPAEQSSPTSRGNRFVLQQRSNVIGHLPSEILDDVHVQQLGHLLSRQLREDLAIAVATISGSGASPDEQRQSRTEPRFLSASQRWQQRHRSYEKQNLPRLLQSSKPGIQKMEVDKSVKDIRSGVRFKTWQSGNQMPKDMRIDDPQMFPG